MDREKIDALIISGASKRSVADQYGLSPTAVQRHKKHILPQVSPDEITTTVLEPAAQIIRSRSATDGFDIENLFHKMEVMVEKSFQIVDKYEMLDPEGKFIATPADVKAKAAAVNSLRGSLEFISKMFGLISPDGISPGYMQLQEEHEKMKKFILEYLCEDCREKLLQELQSDDNF